MFHLRGDLVVYVWIKPKELNHDYFDQVEQFNCCLVRHPATFHSPFFLPFRTLHHHYLLPLLRLLLLASCSSQQTQLSSPLPVTHQCVECTMPHACLATTILTVIFGNGEKYNGKCSIRFRSSITLIRLRRPLDSFSANLKQMNRYINRHQLRQNGSYLINMSPMISRSTHGKKREGKEMKTIFKKIYIYISTLKCREIIGSVCYCVTASVVCGEAHHLHQEWNTLRWPHPIQLSWALEESPSDFFLAIQNNTVVRCYQPWQEKEIFFFKRMEEESSFCILQGKIDWKNKNNNNKKECINQVPINGSAKSDWSKYRPTRHIKRFNWGKSGLSWDGISARAVEQIRAKSLKRLQTSGISGFSSLASRAYSHWPRCWENSFSSSHRMLYSSRVSTWYCNEFYCLLFVVISRGCYRWIWLKWLDWCADESLPDSVKLLLKLKVGFPFCLVWCRFRQKLMLFRSKSLTILPLCRCWAVERNEFKGLRQFSSLSAWAVSWKCGWLLKNITRFLGLAAFPDFFERAMYCTSLVLSSEKCPIWSCCHSLVGKYSSGAGGQPESLRDNQAW